MQKWHIWTSITHIKTIAEAFLEASNQSKWMREVWIGGAAAWLAAAALPGTCESVMFFMHFHEQKRDCLPSSGPIWTIHPQ